MLGMVADTHHVGTSDGIPTSEASSLTATLPPGHRVKELRSRNSESRSRSSHRRDTVDLSDTDFALQLALSVFSK